MTHPLQLAVVDIICLAQHATTNIINVTRYNYTI